MNTKSTIQLIAEQVELNNKFFENLSELVSKYDIKNNVFACDQHGNAAELKEGYFGQVKEYDSLKEVRKEFNMYLQGIRVCENKFYVGNLYDKLSNVKEEVIYDLKNYQKVMG